MGAHPRILFVKHGRTSNRTVFSSETPAPPTQFFVRSHTWRWPFFRRHRHDGHNSHQPLFPLDFLPDQNRTSSLPAARTRRRICPFVVTLQEPAHARPDLFPPPGFLAARAPGSDFFIRGSPRGLLWHLGNGSRCWRVNSKRCWRVGFALAVSGCGTDIAFPDAPVQGFSDGPLVKEFERDDLRSSNWTIVGGSGADRLQAPHPFQLVAVGLGDHAGSPDKDQFAQPIFLLDLRILAGHRAGVLGLPGDFHPDRTTPPRCRSGRDHLLMPARCHRGYSRRPRSRWRHITLEIRL